MGVLKEQANYTVLRHEKRFEAVLMRARFDATRECKDMRKCAAMLEVAEDMLFECQHLYPFKYKFDEGGIMLPGSTIFQIIYMIFGILGKWPYILMFLKNDKQ